jgi:broad specificity phosphatase PhoE
MAKFAKLTKKDIKAAVEAADALGELRDKMHALAADAARAEATLKNIKEKFGTTRIEGYFHKVSITEVEGKRFDQTLAKKLLGAKAAQCVKDTHYVTLRTSLL